MFDMHFDGAENITAAPKLMCGHCIADMEDRGSFFECPICSKRYVDDKFGSF